MNGSATLYMQWNRLKFLLSVGVISWLVRGLIFKTKYPFVLLVLNFQTCILSHFLYYMHLQGPRLIQFGYLQIPRESQGRNKQLSYRNRRRLDMFSRKGLFGPQVPSALDLTGPAFFTYPAIGTAHPRLLFPLGPKQESVDEKTEEIFILVAFLLQNWVSKVNFFFRARLDAQG